MKKLNLLFLILISAFLINCETPEIQEDTKPIDSRGCLFDEQNCDDGPGNPGGGGGSGGGGGTNNVYKIYMKGKNSSDVNQGASSNGTTWNNQGAVTSTQATQSPAAAYLDNRIFTFSSLCASCPVKYSWSDDDGTTWNSNNNLTLDIGTLKGMSAVAFNNAIYVAITRFIPGTPHRPVSVYKSHANTSTPNWAFHSNALSGSENSQGRRGYLAVHDDKLYVFYVTFNQAFYKMYDPSVSNTISWGPEVEITGNINGATISATKGITAYSHNGNLYAVYNSPGNGMVSVNALFTNPTAYYVTTAQTSAWPSLTSDGTHLYLAYKGDTDNHVYYARSTDGQTWTGNLWAVGETGVSPYIISY